MLKLKLGDRLETQKLGIILGQTLPSQSLVLLQGELGSGKTTLVQGIGLGLDINEPIVSPTFTLVNEYLEGRLPLYHLDLYRLEPSEIAQIYPEIYWEGQEVAPGITVIEWGDLLPYRPSKYLQIELKIAPENTRQAKITPIGNLSLDLSQLVSEFPQTD